MKYLIILLRLFFGGMFVYASLDKIIDPESFARAIYNYQLIPPVMINMLALFLPWIELFCGLAIIFNRLPLGGYLIANALMVVFITALSINLYRGVDIACGCFSSETNGNGMLSVLIRDVIFLGIGLFLWIQAARKRVAATQG